MAVLKDVYTNVCKSVHSYICGNYKRASLQLLYASHSRQKVDILNSRQELL